MIPTNVRLNVLGLFLDMVDAGDGTMMRRNGQRFTLEEVALIRSATPVELTTAGDLDAAIREADHNPDVAAAAWVAYQLRFFSRLPDGAVLHDVVTSMNPAERAEFERLMGLAVDAGAFDGPDDEDDDWDDEEWEDGEAS
jgi:hypothetical protein